MKTSRATESDYAGSGVDGPHHPSHGVTHGLLLLVALVSAALVVAGAMVVREKRSGQ